MTINELEAKCRKKIEAGASMMASPKLILQLIEERRLLARLASYLHYRAMDYREQFDSLQLRDRVLQEIAECKQP